MNSLTAGSPVPAATGWQGAVANHIDARQVAHYDAFVRTTLTIDDDVATTLRALARSSGKTFKAVVNEAIRNGLMTGEKPVPTREAFKVPSAPRGFLPGIDPLKLNQLMDDLEADDFLARPHGHGRTSS